MVPSLDCLLASSTGEVFFLRMPVQASAPNLPRSSAQSACHLDWAFHLSKLCRAWVLQAWFQVALWKANGSGMETVPAHSGPNPLHGN